MRWIHNLPLPGLTLALLVLALIATACGGRKAGNSGLVGPTDIKPPELATRPDGQARLFLDQVRDRRFDQAYGLFSQRLQARLSNEAFRRGLGQALQADSTRAAYQDRWVQSERILGEQALVIVSDRTRPQVLPWTWEFRKEGSAWKLWALDLPPVLSHNDY